MAKYLALFLILCATTGRELSAQNDSLPLPDYQFTVNDVPFPDTLSVEWLTGRFGSSPKEKFLTPHEGHFHYRLNWKKLGISVQVKRPSGHVSGIVVYLGKKYEKKRAKAGVDVTITVGQTSIDRTTPIAYLRSAVWTEQPVPMVVINGKKVIPWRYRIRYSQRLLNVFLNNRRDTPERVVLTFEGE